MPLLRNAIKKMRQDKKRTAANKAKRTRMRTMIKIAKTKKDEQSIANAFSAIDKAAKTHLIHKKKANRLKARLIAAIRKTTETTEEPLQNKEQIPTNKKNTKQKTTKKSKTMKESTVNK